MIAVIQTVALSVSPMAAPRGGADVRGISTGMTMTTTPTAGTG
ncbi:hypothetical protein [Brevundimonas sp.]|nr:hypothetical protein [Brevundimonas sp.]